MSNTAISFFIGIACWLTVTSLLATAEPQAQQKIVLVSAAFQPGADIPRKYTCDAEDTSPPLRWANAPSATKSFALIADDPDAPGGTWVHWVIYDLPAETKDLAEGATKTDVLASGAKQGVNDFRKVGYGGPCPPAGAAHRYYFKLYALDAATGLKPRATKQQVLEAIKGHVVGEAELIGRYKR
jgi:Raf kinase inhibitor-like YbhB/YbcL family protein